jgi:hypothetical protein
VSRSLTADKLGEMPPRDHLFISYATENFALAAWLARRLASDGYAVWYDRFKVRGESHRSSHVIAGLLLVNGVRNNRLHA